MATTFVDYTGDGNATKSFSFPSIKEADIKVDVDGVIKTSGNHYNITSYTTTGGGNVVFTSGNIPASPAAIRIFRDTDVDTALATYTAGSSVKAGDLNNNNKQLLYAAQEEQNQTILTSDLKDSAITSAKIKDGTIVNADVNASAAIDGSKINPAFGSQNITTSGTVDGRDVSVDGAKLDGIEAGATGDQTNAEIRAAVEAASDSNVFTDADHSKLNGIESGATADQTNAEIRAAVEAATDSNVFTDADHSKLNAIEAGATADQTASEIRTLVESASDSNVFTDADHSKLNGIASSANNYSHPNHSGEVTSSGDGAMTIADNVVDEANLKVSNSPVNGYMLTAQSGNTGGLTWAPAAAGATGASNDEIFWENGTNVTADYTITNGKNAGSFGPITIDSGVTVTVGSGETWTVV